MYQCEQLKFSYYIRLLHNIDGCFLLAITQNCGCFTTETGMCRSWSLRHYRHDMMRCKALEDAIATHRSNQWWKLWGDMSIWRRPSRHISISLVQRYQKCIQTFFLDHFLVDQNQNSKMFV